MGGKNFSLQMTEPSKYFIELNYPENWKALSLEEKKKISREISIKLGRIFLIWELPGMKFLHGLIINQLF